LLQGTITLFTPTFANLTKLATDNGFRIDDVFWQPQWHDTVCYITASVEGGNRIATALSENKRVAANGTAPVLAHQ
jgi:hypothetical protein